MDIQITIAPTLVSGTINLPASKSITNRVLLIRSIANSFFEIHNCSESNDTILLKKMLASETNILNAEDAGTSMRFITALAASTFGEWIVTGTERMKKRPIGPLVEALKQLGAIIEYTGNEGFPPLKIKGTKLRSCELEIIGNISSQFISALLMIAPTVIDGLTIKIKEPIFSVSYIEMTLQLMKYFGIEYSWNKNTITIAEQDYKPRDFTVESDWSAASYWYEIIAISDKAEIKLSGLKKKSLQGDSILVKIYEQLGVKTTSFKDGIQLSKIPVITTSFQMNCSDCPDIVTALVVTLAMLKIPFNLTGLDSLRIKESDRIIALQQELLKIGIQISVSQNSMMWDGRITEITEKIIFNTYHDHRMAMALAPIVLKIPNNIIKDCDVVNKSYPTFWNNLEQTGFTLIKKG